MTVCYTAPRCETNGCSKPGTVLCRYPVKNAKTGRERPCNRSVCASCASMPDRFCPPHARAIERGSVLPPVVICSVCYCASCVTGEMRCPHPGPPRRVTGAEWKKLLAFGVNL